MIQNSLKNAINFDREIEPYIEVIENKIKEVDDKVDENKETNDEKVNILMKCIKALEETNEKMKGLVKLEKSVIVMEDINQDMRNRSVMFTGMPDENFKKQFILLCKRKLDILLDARQIERHTPCSSDRQI